jgi:hypothetical protein
MFGITPTQVSLRDKKVDQLYILNEPNSALQQGDTNDKSLSQPIIKNVLAFKPYGKNLIAYITNVNEPSGTVAARVWDNGKNYKLNEFSSGTKYMIDLAEFQNHFYYADGSDTSGRINIYKDPLNGLKNASIGKALPVLALHLEGAQKLKFSNNARFIGAQGGQNFAVYDIETQASYQYPLSNSLSAEMDWMDGHRFIGQSGGSVLVMDYDGINKQLVTPTLLSKGAYFSREYNHMLVVAPGSDGVVVLQDIDMRAGTDLPKAKQ